MIDSLVCGLPKRENNNKKLSTFYSVGCFLVYFFFKVYVKEFYTCMHMYFNN